MDKIDRFELYDQIDSLRRVKQVLLAVDRQLAAVCCYLEELEFNARHEEDSDE